MLSINQLHNEIRVREERKKNVYKKILKLCYQKIINTNNKSDQCFCFYNCPEFTYGIPSYNILNCNTFIMEDLIEKGFKVTYTHPNLLYINWSTSNQSNNTKSLEYNNDKNKLEYNNFRDIMDMSTNNNSLLYDNNINNNYTFY